MVGAMGDRRRRLLFLLLVTTAHAGEPLSPAELARTIRWNPRGAGADAAARLLGRAGAKGWKRLGELVMHFDRGDPAATPMLIRHLADGDAEARTERIEKTSRGVRNPKVRAALILALAERYPAGASLVMEHLKKGGARGTDIVRALGRHDASTNVLIECLEFPGVALDAYALLRKRGGEAIGDKIAAAGRKAALLGLEAGTCRKLALRPPDFDLLQAVSGLLQDDQRGVRVGAHALLMHVSGKKLPADTLIWRSWIAAQRDRFKPAAQPTPGAIAAAILRGREYLRARLLATGNCRWTRASSETATMGATALALLALHAAGLGRDDAAIERALRETLLLFDKRDRPGLREIPKEYETYNASLLAMALATLDAERYRPLLETLRSRLVHGQLPNGRWTYVTGFGTGKKPKHSGDNSNAQYAVLGLRALHRAGVEVPSKVWEANAKDWRGMLNKHKGWGYRKQSDWHSARRISMTAAGVASLAICLEATQGSGARAAIDADATIGAGLAGLGRQLFVRGFGGEALYALYSVERAGVLANVRDFMLGKLLYDWYEQGALKLLAMQARDGAWGSLQARPDVDGSGWGPHVDTAYAILFLTRATASIGRGRLKTVPLTLGAGEKPEALLRGAVRAKSKPVAKPVPAPLLRLDSARLATAGDTATLSGRVLPGAAVDVDGQPIAVGTDGWFSASLDATRPRAVVVEARHGDRTARITAHIERDTTPPTVRIVGKPVFGPGRATIHFESDEELSHLTIDGRTIVAVGRNAQGSVLLGAGRRSLSVDAFDRAGNRGRHTLPIEVANRVLVLDGESALGVHMPPMPQAFTVECWARAEPGQKSASLIANTESAGFALYWRHKRHRSTPAAWSFVLGKGYLHVPAEKSPPDLRWVHIAMTVDAERIRIFVDGRPSGEKPGGTGLLSTRHVMVGAEPNSRNKPTSMFLKGALDGVRISRGVLYTKRFRPERQPAAGDDTILLLNFDGAQPFRDESAAHREVIVHGKPQVLTNKR